MSSSKTSVAAVQPSPLERRAGLEAVLLAQIVDAPEALGMAWGKDQQRLTVAALDRRVCAQDQRLFAFVGAPGDPHRPLAADLTAQARALVEEPGRDLGVELDVAGVADRRGIGAERHEPLCVFRRLRGDPLDVADQSARDAWNALVASKRARREPGVGEQDRDPLAPALGQQIGPQLGLHDDHRHGQHAPQKTPHRHG